MKHPKSAYELSQSQVSTPQQVIDLFWKLVHQRRRHFDRVVDFGAGDCRFAAGGRYKQYVGVEIDRDKTRNAVVVAGRTIRTGCAFEHDGCEYDACIGNPPYVRHHDLELHWRERVSTRIASQLGCTLNYKSNLFLYFVCLGILKTHDKGIVALVIPFEWVSRPSARSLRQLLIDRKWEVSVYRFTSQVFPGVLTTSSITIIDKSKTTGEWRYSDVTSTFDIIPRSGPAEASTGVLEYSDRGAIWAMRGMSPGSQSIFCLTEGERSHFGLRKSDVMPCVTSLRSLPSTITLLSETVFNQYFVSAGQRCWLIKSHMKNRSRTLDEYLDGIAPDRRDNYTCKSRNPWYAFRCHPVPDILVSSGFTSFGPKIVINSAGCHAIGSVTGVHSDVKYSVRRLQKYLSEMNFEESVVAHAKTLKKVEVKQLNAVLNAFLQEA